MTEAAVLEVERIKTLGVVGLRRELDKHGLEKSGLKTDLIKRLEKWIMDNATSQEGNDTANPNTVDAETTAVATNGPTSSTSKINGSPLAKSQSAENSKPLPCVVGSETETKHNGISTQKVSSAHVTPAENVSVESDTTTPYVISLEEQTEPISEDEIPGIETETDPVSDEDLPGMEVETDMVSDAELPDDEVEKGAGAQGAAPQTNDGQTTGTTEKNMETDTTEKNPDIKNDSVKHNNEMPPNPKIPLAVAKDNNANSKTKNIKKTASTSTNNKSKPSVRKEKDSVKSNDTKQTSVSKTTATSSTKASKASKEKTLQHKEKETNVEEKNDKASKEKTLQHKEKETNVEEKNDKASKEKTLQHKEKETNVEEKNDLSRSVWITNLSSTTRAVDLKQAFSEHGKVLGAKVVTSAKLPGSQCFGYVTMSTAEEAVACIAKLDKTVLHEQTIGVEKAETDPTPGVRRPPSKTREHKTEERSRHKSSSKDLGSSRSLDEKNRSHDKKSDEEKKKDDASTVKSPTKNRKTSSTSTSKDKSSKEPSKGKASKDTHKEKSPKDSSKEISSTGAAEINDQKKSTSSKSGAAKKTGKSDLTSEARILAEKVAKEMEEKENARKERIAAERKARDDLRRKEKEEEEREREERRKYLAKREKERREWERKESERLRAERERKREEDRARDQERVLREKMANERYLREKRQREERALEEERERLEQERIERESFVRAHQDNNRRRIDSRRDQEERQRVELERQRKEKMDQEERHFRMEKERIEGEISLLKQKCEETEALTVMVDRGLGIKRPGGDDRRDLHPVAKHALHDSPSKYYTFVGRNDSIASTGARDSPRNAINRRQDDIRTNYRDQETFPKASDNRRNIPIDEPVHPYNRERSPHRANYESNQGRVGLPGTNLHKFERDNRVDSYERRDMQSYDSSLRNDRRNDEHRNDERRVDERRVDERRVDERRVDERRVDERRVDERRVDERRIDERRSARYEPGRVDDGYHPKEREKDYKTGVHDPYQNQPSANNTNNDRNFNTNALHPALAREIGGVLPIAGQPRVLPFTDMLGRPLQILPNAQAIHAGYAAAVAQATAQNIALRNMGGRPANTIQLNRNGQLEFTPVNNNPPTNVGLQGGRRM